MLTDKYISKIPAGSRAARADGFLQEQQVIAHQEKIRSLHQLAESAGMPLHHLALRWVLQQQGVTSVIIGARSVAQLNDNLQALQGPTLANDILTKIDQVCPAIRKDNAEA
jgi:L-glyceraldehyde 3-phosphate reductase